MIYLALIIAIVAIVLVVLNHHQRRKVNELQLSYEQLLNGIRRIDAQLQESVRKSEHKNLHNKILFESIIMHLSASGTAYTTRIWDTYTVEMKKAWCFEYEDEPWPQYLPIVGDPNYDFSPRVNKEDFKSWRAHTTGNCRYNNEPSIVVTTDYISDLERRIV